MADQEMKKLYRYTAEWFEDGSVSLYLHEYPVVKMTPCGFRVLIYGGVYRWVSKTSRKRFAHETKEVALCGFWHRKRSFLNHAKARLKQAEAELQLAEDSLAARFPPPFNFKFTSP